MKKLLTAGALLLSCAGAHATLLSWHFSYTGFFDQKADQFLADATIRGSFQGNDLNGDGVLARDELLSLVVDDLDYVACAGSSNAWYQCGASAFSFAPDGGLHFAVGSHGSDPEGWVGGGRLITTGEQQYVYDFNPYGSSERSLLWTDATRLDMVSQVPEPASWALMAVGLAGIGGRMRRRSGATRMRA